MLDGIKVVFVWGKPCCCLHCFGATSWWLVAALELLLYYVLSDVQLGEPWKPGLTGSWIMIPVTALMVTGALQFHYARWLPLHCVPLRGLPLVDGFLACGPMKPVCLMHCRPSASIFLKTMWLRLHIFMQVIVAVAHCKLYIVVLTFAHVGQIVLKQTLKNRSEHGCK